MSKMRVVMVEPDKAARIAEIGTSLEELQAAVGGGLIEVCYPFDEEVCIVCNEEGKLNGMDPCRAIRNEENEVADVIFGPFFVCGCGTERFSSLGEEQLQRYLRRFRYPESFFRYGRQILVYSYDPHDKNEKEE